MLLKSKDNKKKQPRKKNFLGSLVIYREVQVLQAAPKPD